jgi:hypothetical protein
MCCPEDGTRRLPLNAGTYLLNYMASHLRRLVIKSAVVTPQFRIILSGCFVFGFIVP